MTVIQKAEYGHNCLLAEIGEITFRESHGKSASEDNIAVYVKKNYTAEVFKEELADPANNYHIIYSEGQPAGYSNIAFSSPFGGSSSKNISKLDRIYLYQRFYNLGLGAELFRFNVNLSKQNKELGIWLYIWTENLRALQFYKKQGLEIIGSHHFKISENHSNPNHQMYLRY